MIPYNEVLEAVARGWTHPKTAHLEMNAELAEAIAVEVYTSASNHTPYIPEPERELEEPSA